MAVIKCGADKSASRISKYAKCYISKKVGSDEVTVIALLSPDAQLSLTNQWQSPFSGDSIGGSGMLDRVSGLAQVHTQMTSKTALTSQMIWEGAEPPSIDLTLQFIAISDAAHEVERPIAYLRQFATADLRADLPIGTDGKLGRIPSPITVNIARKLIMKMVIHNVSYNLHAPKTRDGLYAYNTVTLTVSPLQMINKPDLSKIFK